MSQEDQKDLEKQESEQKKEENCQHEKQSLNDFLAQLEITKTQKNKEVVKDFINELKGEHKAVFEKRFGNETQEHPNQKYIDEAMIQIDNQSNFSVALKYISMNYFQHDEAFNSQGFTCLHMAVWKGKTDIMLHLLDNLKIDVNLKAKTDQTPLHLAIMRGNILHFKMLLDRGANIESEDLSKITPIICAAQFNRIDMVIILKHYGAYMKVRLLYRHAILITVLQFIGLLIRIIQVFSNFSINSSCLQMKKTRLDLHPYIELVLLMLVILVNISFFTLRKV